MWCVRPTASSQSVCSVIHSGVNRQTHLCFVAAQHAQHILLLRTHTSLDNGFVVRTNTLYIVTLITSYRIRVEKVVFLVFRGLISIWARFGIKHNLLMCINIATHVFVHNICATGRVCIVKSLVILYNLR